MDQQSRSGPVRRALQYPWWAGIGSIASVLAVVLAVVALPGTEPKSPATPGTAAPPSAPLPAPPSITLSAEKIVSSLAAGVQVSTYSNLLGDPYIRREVTDSTSVEWIWIQQTFAVQAIVNKMNNVDMYTVTVTDSSFHPALPYDIGVGETEVRLGKSTFADVDAAGYVGTDFIYPANAKYHYSELYGCDGTFHYRCLVLTQSWDGTGARPIDADPEDGLISDLEGASCSEAEDGEFGYCRDVRDSSSKLAKARERMIITGFTMTAEDFDINSISVNFSPWILSSRCDIPTGCR
jgi:hypothetical protein